jgi:mannose-6-phosphate isomerase-like protein (cupin superfamily)
MALIVPALLHAAPAMRDRFAKLKQTGEEGVSLLERTTAPVKERSRMPEPGRYLPETETAVPIIRPPGSGKVIGVLGAQSTFKVLSAQTGGAYAILEQQVPAGHGPALHVHRHETEIFYILEGQFEVTLGDQKVSAPAGAMVVGPRDIPHTFRNVGSTTGKLLLTVIPGRFADFFLEVDQVADSDRAAIRALCAKYDVEILE